MAKQATESAAVYESLRKEILQGKFRPFYLLFGKEHYFIDALCDLICEKAMPEAERAFGQVVYYGSDVNANQVVTTARQFPMMVQRQLVVVKEAQMMGDLEQVAVYFDGMLDTTILVICYKTPNDPAKSSSKNIDKRTSFYKKAVAQGGVFESTPIPDYKVAGWIEWHFKGRGLTITPDGAALLAEFAGGDIHKIVVEADKLTRALPAGVLKITAEDVGNNVGMSRDYSIFELTRALSYRDAAKTFRIAGFFAQSEKRYPLQMLLPVLSAHFIRLLRFHALLRGGRDRSQAMKELGINAYFAGEYDTALRNFPVKGVMRAISILKEYDYRSKSPARGSASDGELLQECIAQLLGK